MRRDCLQSRWRHYLRAVKSFSAACAIVLITGCASNTQSIAQLDKGKIFYKQGRLSIKVESETPQSLSGAFAIKGTALQGDLRLFSPLGNTLAQVAWTPTEATLIAHNETKRFAHIDALLQELTGTVLPLTALFDWLIAVPTPAEGWQVDLSHMQQVERPRLFAKRTSPLPAAELRVVLEP